MRRLTSSRARPGGSHPEAAQVRVGRLTVAFDSSGVNEAA